MFKKILVIFLILYVLALFQTSFLIHFFNSGEAPNLVLIFLFWLIFFDLISFELTPWAVFFAGFFLDLFSVFPLGLSVLLFGLGTLLVKRILESIHQPNFLSFAFLFLIFFFFYNFGLAILDYFLNGVSLFFLNRHFLFHLLYNFVVALLGPILICLNSKYPKFLKTKR